MSLNLPKPIKNNSTIGLLCPAGGFDDYKPIKLVIKYLKSIGYKVKTGKHLLSSKKDYKYLSGTDKQRLSDFMSLWADKDVDAIFCLRGGYGSLRLINDIDFNVIRKNKKIILGFSDITVLLLAIFAKTNLVTFHGPLLGYSFLKGKPRGDTLCSIETIWKVLRNPQFQFAYEANSVVVYPGRVEGTLLGGNLTDICSMIGSGFLPSFKDSILFLEDVYEEPYRIDRLLTQLLNAKIFNQAKALIFSSFEKCKFGSKKDIVKLINDRVGNLNKPIVFNLPVGHGAKNYVVPIGRKVLLDTNNLILKSI